MTSAMVRSATEVMGNKTFKSLLQMAAILVLMRSKSDCHIVTCEKFGKQFRSIG